MSRYDSPQTTETSHSPSNSTSQSGGGCGDVLLQWGHRKRARVSRAVIEDSSSSIHSNKQRRISHTVSSPLAAKLSSSSMPPPPPPPPLISSAASNGRPRKDSPRNLEDPSAAGSESPSRNRQSSNPIVSKSAASKLSPFGMEKSNRRMPSSGSAKYQKPNGSSTTHASERLNSRGNGNSASVQPEQETGVLTAAATSLAANGDKGTVEVIEWPRICLTLSRKEKEDDFLAMKGTKIPQRPKKRAKNIDRTLQYCFPGMWLADLTKSRYEVREKKSVKKQKRRGLKGMEDSDSE